MWTNFSNSITIQKGIAEEAPSGLGSFFVFTYVFLLLFIHIHVCTMHRSAESSVSLETACVAWSAVGGQTSERLDSAAGGRMSASYEERIVVNVSGLRFETHLSTVERFSRTLLGDAVRRDRSVAFRQGSDFISLLTIIIIFFFLFLLGHSLQKA